MTIEREPSSELFQGEGDALPKLERAQVLHLEPGDIIVVNLPEDVRPEDGEHIARHIRAHIPGYRVFVAPHDMSFSVLRGVAIPPLIDKDLQQRGVLTDEELAILNST